MKKIYVIKKYVAATSIKDALKKERDIKPDDIWMEEYTAKDHLMSLIRKKKSGF